MEWLWMKSIFMNDDQSLASEDIADFDFLVARMEALSIGEVLMWSWLILAEVDSMLACWLSTGEWWWSILDMYNFHLGTGWKKLGWTNVQTKGSVLHGRLSSCPRSWIQKLDTHLVQHCYCHPNLLSLWQSSLTKHHCIAELLCKFVQKKSAINLVHQNRAEVM